MLTKRLLGSLLLLTLLMAVVISGCSGLGILQNPATTTTQQDAIMKYENARGCIYFNGNAQPWANVKTMIVGTWGKDPPPYSECFTGLPTGF